MILQIVNDGLNQSNQNHISPNNTYNLELDIKKKKKSLNQQDKTNKYRTFSSRTLPRKIMCVIGCDVMHDVLMY